MRFNEGLSLALELLGGRVRHIQALRPRCPHRKVAHLASPRAKTDACEVVARRAPVRGIFCSASCSLGALAYNSAHDECTRHTISQSRAHRVGWSMALASSLLSELEAPFSCTRMTKRRKALIFRRLEASPISANYVRHARKAVPCSSPMNSSTLLKSNSKP